MSNSRNIAEPNYAICNVSVAPVRKRPSDRSEMISQILFGECVKILDKKGRNWVAVQCLWDDYVGWIDPKQIIPIDEKKFRKKYNGTKSFALESNQAVMNGALSLPILTGTCFHNFDGISFNFPNGKYIYSGQVINSSKQEISKELFTKLLKKYLNAPYLWGGRSPFGIDCSGYTQVIFGMCGISLPRDAFDQSKIGKTVDFIQETTLGDLAFFENNDHKIIHVGILLPDLKIIHASGKVRIDPIDHQGIYNTALKRYTHKLRIIKRTDLFTN